MKELATLRNYFKFRESKGANVAQPLEAIDTIEAYIHAQQVHLQASNNYREMAKKLLAAICTAYYTRGRHFGADIILNTSVQDILLDFVSREFPEHQASQRAAELEVLINEALDARATV